MRAQELVEQAGFPDAGIAHHGHDLATAAPGLLAGLAHLLHLGVAADEPREAAGAGRLQPRPRAGRRRQLEDLDRLGEALHRDGAERAHLHESLGEAERLGRQADRAGRR